MFLEVYERQKLMVQTECHLAECSRTEAATGNARWPTVDRRYDGTSRCSVKDDRRRRRPVRLDTGNEVRREQDIKIVHNLFKNKA